MPQNPAILIVGAGAMGMLAGYHLSLAGADVSFYVRPSRLAALKAPQILYCYNDGSLKHYSGYRAISSVAEIAAESLDYVMFTLDGATSRSAEGSELLRAIGAAIRDTSAMLMIGGVGVGLREHVLQTSGLPPQRVMNGFLGLLCYQVAAAQIPVTPPTRADVIGQASLAYVQFPSKVGFVLDSAVPQAAKAFAALYNRSGVSRCSVISPTLSNIISNMVFPLFAVSEIASWPSIGELAKNKTLWRLNTRAQAEIIGLKQHGWTGKLMRLLMTESMQLRLLKKVEKDALPMDFQAFNRFHHGGKVQAQDIEIMQNCVAVGVSQGFKMSALKEVLARLDAHKQASFKTSG